MWRKKRGGDWQDEKNDKKEERGILTRWEEREERREVKIDRIRRKRRKERGEIGKKHVKEKDRGREWGE